MLTCTKKFVFSNKTGQLLFADTPDSLTQVYPHPRCNDGANKIQYWAISLQLSCSVTMTPSLSVSPKNWATILAARLPTWTYKMLAWSQDSRFYFHPIECWVGESLTGGTHSTRVHYGKKTAKIGSTIYCMWILLWHHLHKDCCSSCSPFLEMLSQSNSGSSIVWGAQAQVWGVDLVSMFPRSHWRFWSCVGSNKTVSLGAYLESIPRWVQAVAVEKRFDVA